MKTFVGRMKTFTLRMITYSVGIKTFASASGFLLGAFMIDWV